MEVPKTWALRGTDGSVAIAIAIATVGEEAMCATTLWGAKVQQVGYHVDATVSAIDDLMMMSEGQLLAWVVGSEVGSPHGEVDNGRC